MALSIKNPEVIALVRNMAAVTGETYTEVVRVALAERLARLRLQGATFQSLAATERYLERTFWRA